MSDKPNLFETTAESKPDQLGTAALQSESFDLSLARGQEHRINVCLGDLGKSGFHFEKDKLYNIDTNCPSDIAAAKRAAIIQRREQEIADKNRIQVCVEQLGHDGFILEKGKSYNIITDCHSKRR